MNIEMMNNSTDFDLKSYIDITFFNYYLIRFKPVVILVGILYILKFLFIASQASCKAIKMNVWVKIFTKSLKENYGDYVIITNVTDCIGFEFARAFAKQGHSLILISVKCERFDKIKAILDKCVHPDKQIKPLLYDETLTEDEQYSNIEKCLNEVKDNIGILVNNCSVVLKSKNNFVEYDRKDILSLIYADIANPLVITRMVLPLMAANKKGLILNVTIPDNFRPVEYKGFPYVMREFVDFFGSIIKNECEPYNIDVQTVNPGWISMKRRGNKRFPSFLVQTPGKFVDSVMPSVGRTDQTSGYWIHTVVDSLVDNAPSFIHKIIYYLYRIVNEKYDNLNESDEGQEILDCFDSLIKECEVEQSP